MATRSLTEDRFLEVYHDLYHTDMRGRFFHCSQQSSDFIDALITQTDADQILEIGFGGGYLALSLLHLDDRINLTSIDVGRYTYVKENMHKVHNAIGDRFRGMIWDSGTYDLDADPKKDHYELVIIDGGKEGVDRIIGDMTLADQTGADRMLICDILHPAVKRSLQIQLHENDAFNWEWERTTIHHANHYDETGDRIATETVSGLLIRQHDD